MADHKPMDMKDSKASAGGAMDMHGAAQHDIAGMAGAQPAEDEVRAKELELERLRALQRRLEQAYQREVAAQKEEDARAHELLVPRRVRVSDVQQSNLCHHVG